MRITPSSTAMTVSDWMNRRKKPAIRSGSTIKIPMAMNTEKIITAVITTLSIFSPNLSIRKLSNFPGASSSSSSSKKLADQVRVFIPRIIESAKLKIPRTNGREKNFTFSVILTYVSFWITISPSGFLTAVA